MASEPISKEEFLEIWRRIFPGDYTTPIEEEAGGQGFDIPSQQAAQFARLTEAINTTTQAYYLRPHSTQTGEPAGGARAAIGSVEITRGPPLTGDYVIAEGIELQAATQGTRGELVLGPVFKVTEDTTIPAGSTVPVTAPIAATRVGYQGNLPPGRIVAFVERGRATVTADVTAANELRDNGVPDRFAVGMLGQFIRFAAGANLGTFPRRIVGVTQGPTTMIQVDGPALTLEAGATVEVLEFADLGLTVAQSTATRDGRHGFLDAIGFERRAGRAPGESDDTYRERLSELADTISPAAILRIAGRILSPLGIPFRLLETRDMATLPGLIFDLDPFDFGDITDGQLLLADGAGAVRFFVLVVGLSGLGEFGAPFDTPFPDNAWDFLFFDGYAVGFATALQALYDAIEAARLGGVAWRLVLDPTL